MRSNVECSWCCLVEFQKSHWKKQICVVISTSVLLEIPAQQKAKYSSMLSWQYLFFLSKSAIWSGVLKPKPINCNSQSEGEKDSQEVNENAPGKRGKLLREQESFVLVLNLIGGEDRLSFLDQSQTHTQLKIAFIPSLCVIQKRYGPLKAQHKLWWPSPIWLQKR